MGGKRKRVAEIVRYDEKKRERKNEKEKKKTLEVNEGRVRWKRVKIGEAEGEESTSHIGDTVSRLNGLVLDVD